jgi:group I intron endonuclease
MPIYSIYKITNKINGKNYIGFDSQWPRRKNQHKHYLKSRKSKIYLAFNKYGWENFVWEVIYQSKDGKHCLNVMESYFINEYNSYLNGYNETLGGDGTLGWIPSEEYRKKKSKEQKGEKGFWYGKSIPQETKKKISNTLAKEHRLEYNGKIIMVHNLKQFCIDNNLNRSHLYAVLRGKRKQHKGWKLKFLEV